MATNLPASGTLRYNGVTFSGMSRSKISGTPEYDEAGRTVKWIKWIIEVDGYITAGAFLTTDTEMEDLRASLMTPGKALRVRTKGFGDLDVNGGGRVKDVNWGPKPELLSWDPVGDSQAAMISWRVTTCIPECDNPQYTGIAAFNYETSWEIDSEGYTTRTVTGYLEIAQTRQQGNNRRIPKSADGLRFLCRTPPIDGWERKQSFKESKNKNRLDFTITDRQLPTALPNGVTKCDLSYSVSSDLKAGFRIWNLRLGGAITVPAGAPRSRAWDAFFLVLSSRIAGIRGRLINRRFVRDDGVQGKTLLLTAMEVSEQIFGTSTSFNLTFRLLGADLEEILVQSGLWKPIEGVSAAAWTQSLAVPVYDVRGQAQLEYVSGEDSIIDLCLGANDQNKNPPMRNMRRKVEDPGGDGEVLREAGPRNSPPRANPGGEPEPPPAVAPAGLGPRGRVGAAGGGREGGGLDPAGTWLAYQCDLRILTPNRVARHKRLPAGENLEAIAIPSSTGKTDVTRLDFLASSTGGDPSTPEPPARDDGDVVQTTGTPAYEVEISGYALRLGYKPPAPRLVTIRGVQVTQKWADVSDATVSTVGGYPVFMTKWTIRYILPRAFRGHAPEMANPMLGLPGG